MQNEVWGLTDVNRTTGLISLRRDINELDVSTARYEFMITATDSGDTPLSGSARVVVRVLNCTEREFFYSSPYFYFEMRENGNQFTDGRTGQVIAASFSPDMAEFYPADFPENPFSINLNVKQSSFFNPLSFSFQVLHFPYHYSCCPSSLSANYKLLASLLDWTEKEGTCTL